MCQFLEDVDLSDRTIHSKEIDVIPKILKSNLWIGSLVLSDMVFEDHAAVSLVQVALISNPKLLVLGFWSCTVS